MCSLHLLFVQTFILLISPTPYPTYPPSVAGECCECIIESNTPNCDADPICTNTLCNKQPYAYTHCCNVAWDDLCANNAQLICTNSTIITNESTASLKNIPSNQPSKSPTSNPSISINTNKQTLILKVTETESMEMTTDDIHKNTTISTKKNEVKSINQASNAPIIIILSVVVFVLVICLCFLIYRSYRSFIPIKRSKSDIPKMQEVNSTSKSKTKQSTEYNNFEIQIATTISVPSIQSSSPITNQMQTSPSQYEYEMNAEIPIAMHTILSTHISTDNAADDELYEHPQNNRKDIITTDGPTDRGGTTKGNHNKEFNEEEINGEEGNDDDDDDDKVLTYIDNIDDGIVKSEFSPIYKSKGRGSSMSAFTTKL